MDDMIILLQGVFDVWPRGRDRERHIVRNRRNEVDDRASTPRPSKEKETGAESIRLFAQVSDRSCYR